MEWLSDSYKYGMNTCSVDSFLSVSHPNSITFQIIPNELAKSSYVARHIAPSHAMPLSSQSTYK